jgi:hypothetical protein
MIDPQRLDQTYACKRARVGFADGEIAEVKIITIALPNKYDKTPESWGIVYDVISSNRQRTAPKGAASWSRVSEIETIEILGDAT